MCGFAGRVNVARPVARAQLDAMSALVAHRGPDGAGLWQAGHAGLAHRRLAIVDRAGGAQPAVGEDGRVVLAYNGEVYNHAALRAELEARGHRFASRCDTEAILHGHEEWGPGAAGRLRGMFAYAAWEPGRGRLTLVRDRLGIKPLYYAHLPSGDLLFASELKALLVEAAVDRGLDEDAVDAYLALRYVPAPATLLRGVRKLEPGTALAWQAGETAVNRYWTVPAGPVPDAPAPPPTVAEAGGRLCALLDEVVELRRMGEVPIGAFLSGGVDSTLVTALLARAARAEGLPPPCSYAVGFAGPEAEGTDERAWAALAARALGTAHAEVVVDGRRVARDLDAIAWSLDEPIGDPAATPLWYLARRARREVTVVLSGEGADEVFAGYACHRHLARAGRAARVPGATRAAALGARLLPPGRLQRALALIAAARAPLPARYHGVSRAFPAAARPAWGAPGGLERLLAPAWARAGAGDELARVLAFDQQVWLPDDLLCKADRTTMAHALELRVPLLDHRMLEEVAGWPAAWKLAGGVGKAILRRAAAGLVPPAILARAKLGFATPAAAWLRGPLCERLRDTVLAAGALPAARGGRRLVEDLLAEHAAGRDRSPELWALLALELWRTVVAAGVAAVPDEAPELARVGP